MLTPVLATGRGETWAGMMLNFFREAENVFAVLEEGA